MGRSQAVEEGLSWRADHSAERRSTCRRADWALAIVALCAAVEGCGSGSTSHSGASDAPAVPFKDSDLAPRAQLGICALYGLGFPISAVSSPDDSLVAVAGESVVVLLDAHTGAELRRIVSPNHGSVLAISPDSTFLAVTGSVLTIYRTSDGAKALTIPVDGGSVAFSPDGSLVLTYGLDLAAYRVVDGSKVWEHGGSFFGGIASDGSGAVVLTQDMKLQLLDVATGDVKAQGGEAHVSNDFAVALSPAGVFAWTRPDDQRVIELVPADGSMPARSISAHDSPIHTLSFSRDGKRLLSVPEQGMLKIWDVETAALVTSVSGSDRAAISADGHGVVSATNAGAEWIDLDTGQHQFEYSWGHTGLLETAVFSPDGSQVATTADDFTLRLWDAATGEQQRVISDSGGVLDAVYSPDGKLLFVEDANHLYTYSRPDMARVRQVDSARSTFDSIVVSQDSAYVAADEPLVGIHVWRTGDGTEVSTISAPGGGDLSHQYALSPDGSRLVLVEDTGHLGVYRVSDGMRAQSHEGLYDPAIGKMGFTPGGDRLLVTGPKHVEVLSWPDMKTAALLGAPGQTWSFAISPVGEEALTMADDYTLRLFRIADGAEVGLGDLASVPGSARISLSFAPHDPTRIISGFGDAARLYCRAPSDGWTVR